MASTPMVTVLPVVLKSLRVLKMRLAMLAEGVQGALDVVFLEQGGRVAVLVAMPAVIMLRRLALVHPVVLIAEEGLVALTTVGVHDEGKMAGGGQRGHSQSRSAHLLHCNDFPNAKPNLIRLQSSPLRRMFSSNVRWRPVSAPKEASVCYSFVTAATRNDPQSDSSWPIDVHPGRDG